MGSTYFQKGVNKTSKSVIPGVFIFTRTKVLGSIFLGEYFYTETPAPWLNTLIVVHKGSGNIRLCLDMRNASRVNERTVF